MTLRADDLAYGADEAFGKVVLKPLHQVWQCWELVELSCFLKFVKFFHDWFKKLSNLSLSQKTLVSRVMKQVHENLLKLGQLADVRNA